MNEPSSEGVGNIPQPSENFGTIPNASEPFRTVRNISERTEKHTLTVREVARHFEQAGVARLDAFFDENEGRYYITQQSVTRAIEEERAKQFSMGTAKVSEKEIPKQPETNPRHDAHGSERSDRLKELERQNRDLEITTRAKDYYIEQLSKERGQFHEQIVAMSRYVGELETQVLRLGGAPRGDNSLPHASEAVGKTRHGSEPHQNEQAFAHEGMAL